jgi:hypothetical protein
LAPTTIGTSQITGALLGEVVQQIWGIRTDADTQPCVASTKTPQHYFTAPYLTEFSAWRKWVARTSSSPFTRHWQKTLARKVWQQYVNATAAALDYQGLNIIISGRIANKLANIDIGMPLLGDLSKGINIYQLGASTNINTDSMCKNTTAYDLAILGATGNFHALFNVINSKLIELPMNLYMTESQLKMKHVLIQTMWGPDHSAILVVTTHIDRCHRHHEILLQYRPQVAHRQNLTPVIVA